MHYPLIRASLSLSVRRQPRRRRAIILLVVLGMLAMFALLTATYIIFTSKSREASFAIGRREARSVDDSKLLDLAIGQVLRGTGDSSSALRGHSLLEDYYGNDRIEGKVTDAVSIAAQIYSMELMYGQRDLDGDDTADIRESQFLKIPVEQDDTDGAFDPLFNTPDALNERFLTFEEGPLQGFAFEIVRSFADKPSGPTQGNRFSIVLDLGPHLDQQIFALGLTQSLREWLPSGNMPAFFYSKGPDGNWGDSSGAPASEAGKPLSDDIGIDFTVSPRARNGKGYGWKQASGAFNLEATYSPRQNGFEGGSGAVQFAAANVPVIYQGNHALLNRSALPDGDTDESYDIADYHDYLLGYYPPNVDPSIRAGVTAPSGIRPAMLNYLLHFYDGTDPTAWTVEQRLSLLRMLQRASLRPIPVVNGLPGEDPTGGRYGKFTGSNNAPSDALRRPIDIDKLKVDGDVGKAEALRLAAVYNLLINGPWDVDSDGDGIADSVWIDAGLPMTTMPDGTLVRPMVALRVEDLDNRVDINVTDSAASVATITGPPDYVSNGTRSNSMTGRYAGAHSQTNIRSGFGFGPAEILFSSFLRQDRGAQLITARYGDDFTPGVAPASAQLTPVFPGDDALSVWSQFGRTARHNLMLFEPFDGSGSSHGKQPYPHSLFGMPIDVHGRSLLAADYYGQPMLNAEMSTGVLLPFNVSAADDVVSNPYQMLYNSSNGSDNAYSVGDLESVLRYRDWDRVDLQRPLRNVVDAELQHNERIVGTNRPFEDSQIQRGTLTSAITTVSATAATPGAMLPAQYASSSRVNRSYNPVTRLALSLVLGAGDKLSDTKYDMLIPPELRRGERLDLNRPFGNGVDWDSTGATLANRIPPIGNLTVDNPSELMSRTEEIFATPSGNASQMLGDFTPRIGSPSIPNNFNSDADSATRVALNTAMRSDLSRVELARHLYVMAYIIVSEGNVSGDAYDFAAETGSGIVDEIRARKLAQWAVNVVDFRDRDAIMTRFEYDPNPLNGWDENPLQHGSADPGPVHGEWPVVWGCEQPELLLTESFNFHDRRVRDTALDTSGEERYSGGAIKDEDMDQVRIPQGSTFLELYCPRGPKPAGNGSDMHATPPPELYSMLSRNQLYGSGSDDDLVPLLDIGRLAPDGNPVWRIGVSDVHQGAGPPFSPQNRFDGMNEPIWDTFTLQPEHPELNITQARDSSFRFDRVIWFANQNPNNVGTSGAKLPTDSRESGNTYGQPIGNSRYKVYFNRFTTNEYRGGAVIGLQGGQYAMVGPRRRTYVGAMQYDTATGPTSFDAYAPEQHFDLHPYNGGGGNAPGFQAYVPNEAAGSVATKLITPTPQNSIREIVPILAAALPPSGWTDSANTAPTGIGINISEPIPDGSYYSEPKHFLDSGEDTDVLNLDGYAKDAYRDYDVPANTYIDEPLDSRTGAPLEGYQETGTREDFRTAYLQRLADPTIEYNAVTNPYITVDWISLDLTVFNGEDNNDREVGPNAAGDMEPVDPRDPNPYTTDPEEKFASRSKDGLGLNPDGSTRFAHDQNILWSFGTQPPVDSAGVNNTSVYQPYFDHIIVHRADMNDAYTAPNYPTMDAAIKANYDAAARNQNSQTLGYLNHNFGTRTFVSGGASLNDEMWEGAPASQPFPWIAFHNREFASPYELMLVPSSSPGRLMLEFSVKRGATDPYKPKSAPGDSDMVLERDFGHLLNFFANSADVELAPNFYRMFEYVGTPDPYIASKELMDPQRFWMPETNRELDALSIYFPPFNFRQQGLRRGRINLNTVNNPLVWRSLMFLHSTTTERAGKGAFWDEWMNSRRGPGVNFPLDPEFPTQFVGALRPAESAWIAPRTPGAIATNPTALRFPGIDSTLFRKTTDTTGAVTDVTLFTRDNGAVPARDWNRNAFFRYQTLMRMANLTSDNSNVYAVWSTLGYFEVNPNTFQVGQEYGIQQGTNERPRAFYIIDRSVPVDFRVGEDTNSRDTILLERFLQ